MPPIDYQGSCSFDLRALQIKTIIILKAVWASMWLYPTSWNHTNYGDLGESCCIDRIFQLIKQLCEHLAIQEKRRGVGKTICGKSERERIVGSGDSEWGNMGIEWGNMGIEWETLGRERERGDHSVASSKNNREKNGHIDRRGRAYTSKRCVRLHKKIWQTKDGNGELALIEPANQV